MRETSDQRDTTWKMRRDGSRTWLPSPPCRYAHWLAQPVFGWLCAVFQIARLLFRVFLRGICVGFFYQFHFPPILASKVPVLKPTDLMVEVRPRRVFSNGHTYHVNSISVNSDGETYLSADDLRINMWHLDITDRSFNILLVLLVPILKWLTLTLSLKSISTALTIISSSTF